MTNINNLKKSWLDLDEIESIKRWIKDLENWNTFNENEFYSNLEKRIFSKKEKNYV